MHLTRNGRQVTLVVRGNTLADSMSSYLRKSLDATANIDVRLGTDIVGAVEDDDWLDAVVLRDLATGETETLDAGGLFILIGAVPHTDWLPAEIERDDWGFVVTDRTYPRRRAPGCLAARAPAADPRDQHAPVFAIGERGEDRPSASPRRSARAR